MSPQLRDDFLPSFLALSYDSYPLLLRAKEVDPCLKKHDRAHTISLPRQSAFA